MSAVRCFWVSLLKQYMMWLHAQIMKNTEHYGMHGSCLMWCMHQISSTLTQDWCNETKAVFVTLMSGFDAHRSAAAAPSLRYILKHRAGSDHPSIAVPGGQTRWAPVRLSYIHRPVCSCFWTHSGYTWPTSAEPHQNLGCTAHAHAPLSLSLFFN